tara:strand:- start:4879 stop:6468 length:1590 start_codon:yes stop_codon:yes gene_type:complete
MSREYDNEQSLQKRIMAGADAIADNVGSTLGPRGRNVLLKEKDGTPFITKDGVTVAHFVALRDEFENAGAEIIRQAAIETNNNAGDGTTTSTVLARAILRESQKYIASGISPIEIQRGVLLAVKEVASNLKDMAKPVRTVEEVTDVASISANNDKSIGRLISTAVDKVGQDGAITIEESRSLETSLDIMEGFRLKAGYCAGAFVTDERRAIMQHDEPMFLITDYKITMVDQILPILELAARESRALIIVCEEIEGQALAAIIMNAMRGSLKVAAIKAPMYGEERRSILEDLASSTGANFITRTSGTKLQQAKLTDLGSAQSIESTKLSTTIIGGSCDYEAIETKIESLKEQMRTTDELAAATSIQERIARLASGVAVIRVGGATAVEVTEKKHRIEDALEAVRSAQEQGIIPGGGCALLRASRTMTISTVHGEDHTDQIVGAVIVKKACQEPIRQMALNAGESPDLIVDSVLKKDTEFVWNFRAGELSDCYESGIIDPVKVTISALQNAASCASTLITTNFGIIQTEDK